MFMVLRDLCEQLSRCSPWVASAVRHRILSSSALSIVRGASQTLSAYLPVITNDPPRFYGHGARQRLLLPGNGMHAEDVVAEDFLELRLWGTVWGHCRA